MAKRKGSSQRQQAQHKSQKKSQHDKRERLEHRNADRRKTTAARVPLIGMIQTMVSVLQTVLDRRVAFRFAVIVSGRFLAGGRRTASSWFVAAGVQDDWDRFYDCLISVGRTSARLASAMLGLIVKKLVPGNRIVLVMDDSPTSRYGRHVEGAGRHRRFESACGGITIRRPVRLTVSGCSDTTGCALPGWVVIHSGCDRSAVAFDVVCSQS